MVDIDETEQSELYYIPNQKGSTRVRTHSEGGTNRWCDVQYLPISHIKACIQPVRPDWAIYWTLGNFLKPLATINLTKSPTF